MRMIAPTSPRRRKGDEHSAVAFINAMTGDGIQPYFSLILNVRASERNVFDGLCSRQEMPKLD